MGKTLYLFIDESGNFDFTSNGTKHFVLTGFGTFDPVIKRNQILKLKYGLLKKGIDQEYFHATEDSQTVRDKIYEIIGKLDIEARVAIIDKTKTDSELYVEEYVKSGRLIKRVVGTKFYHLTCQVLLHRIFETQHHEKIDRIIVILGAIFTFDKQKIIIKALKIYLNAHFEIPFEIYFHSSKADLNCQIADYLGWAVFVKMERNEVRPFNLIKSKIKMTHPSILAEEPRGSYQ